ncbi:MAG: ABC transporter ATP-binding protein [Clostridia bacterium]|nr:ABC transporter ATP-binding protein [Clostridia bacterium]
MSDYVQMKEITKSFGKVLANSRVSLSVRKGEIHALLGENGSGKSTLMNMLSGIYSPDSGTILLGDKPHVFDSPRDAIEAGISMVHQHFKLVEVMTVKENIVAGTSRRFLMEGESLSQRIREIGERYGLSVDPEAKVYDLSVGQKQTVEILKMLYRGADVLILDEPTAVLTPQETGVLFDILRTMREQGCAIIIITHKLNEVMELSDRVTVLRRGECIGTVNTAETTPQQLTEMMVGRPVQLRIDRAEAERTAEPVLVVKNLGAKNLVGVETLKDMSFSMHGGEILGVAGVAGSGQRELCEILAGLMTASSGSVRFQGEEILGLSPIEITRKGVSMSFVPEDRLGMGLVAGMDITSNVLLRSFQKDKGFFLDRRSGREKAEQIVERYEVSTPSVRHILKKLSGGNIQKVLLGREVDMEPTLLITAYPVRGLDIGASYHVYDILNQQKQQGVAVLFIGEDLDVLMQICDRLMVLHAGEVMGIVDPAAVTKEEIGLMMMGEKAADAAAEAAEKGGEA